jgi:hypothetical protein
MEVLNYELVNLAYLTCIMRNLIQRTEMKYEQNQQSAVTSRVSNLVFQ